MPNPGVALVVEAPKAGAPVVEAAPIPLPKVLLVVALVLLPPNTDPWVGVAAPNPCGWVVAADPKVGLVGCPPKGVALTEGVLLPPKGLLLAPVVGAAEPNEKLEGGWEAAGGAPNAGEGLVLLLLLPNPPNPLVVDDPGNGVKQFKVRVGLL